MDTNSMGKAATSATAPKTTLQKSGTTTTAMSPSKYVGNLLEKYKADITQALPSVMTPERLTRIITTSVASNPKLYKAVVESPQTFVGAAMTAAQLGLEPNTPLGQCYMLPFYNYNKAKKQKVMEVTLQIGYQGIIDMCYRGGEVAMIQAHVVYEKDHFKYELGLDPKLEHIPYRGKDKGKAIYYYGMFKTKSGATGFECMSYEDVLEHARKYSKSYNADTDSFSGPWQTDFDAMAKKTVIIAALKYAPKKTDFARALGLDNVVKSVTETGNHDMTIVPNEEVIDVEAVSSEKSDDPSAPSTGSSTSSDGASATQTELNI